MRLFFKKLFPALLLMSFCSFSEATFAQNSAPKNIALYLCQIYFKYMPQAEAGILMYVDTISGEVRGIKKAKVTLPNGSTLEELTLNNPSKAQKYNFLSLVPVSRSYMDGYLINGIELDFRKGGDSIQGRISTYLNGRKTDLQVQSFASCRQVKE